MKNTCWNEKEDEILLFLRNKNVPYCEIAKTINKISGVERSESSARARHSFLLKNMQEKINSALDNLADSFPTNDVCEHAPPMQDTTPLNTTVVNSKTFRDVQNRIEEIQAKYLAERVKVTVGQTKGRLTKILSLSDIHFPIADWESLEKAILDNVNDTDILVLNGDILEGHSFSVYDKDMNVSALHEYQAAFEFVKLCSTIFPQVYLVDGNHDVRAGKALKRYGLTDSQSDIFRPNLLARIANGEELDSRGCVIQKHDFQNVHYEHSESWYIRIGKTIFAHPHNRGSSKPGWTVQQVANYFNTRYQAGEIDCVVIGHTHKSYKGVHQNQLLIEQGCLASLMTYAHSPKMEFFGGGVQGYAVVYQDEDGNCDFNQSSAIYLGSLMPPKKDIIKVKR